MKASSKHLLACTVVASLALSGCSLFKLQPAGSEAPPLPGAPAAPKPPDKGDPNQRFAQALDLYKKNQVQEAETAFTALAKDFPEYSGPLTNLGIIYAKSNRRDQAISVLAHALTLNPENLVALDWLGILYRQAGNLGAARGAYEKALSIKSDDALAHYNLAILLDVYLHQPDQALPHYKEYERLAGKQDLKVMAWVAEIEAQSKPAPAPTSAPEAKP
jgi:tetratricopeptide (TPR) repeat protein